MNTRPTFLGHNAALHVKLWGCVSQITKAEDALPSIDVASPVGKQIPAPLGQHHHGQTVGKHLGDGVDKLLRTRRNVLFQGAQSGLKQYRGDGWCGTRQWFCQPLLNQPHYFRWSAAACCKVRCYPRALATQIFTCNSRPERGWATADFSKSLVYFSI